MRPLPGRAIGSSARRSHARPRGDRGPECWPPSAGSALDAAFDVGERDRDVAGGLLAGAVAFRLFLWLVPFSLAAVTIAGWMAADTDLTTGDLARRLRDRRRRRPLRERRLGAIDHDAGVRPGDLAVRAAARQPELGAGDPPGSPDRMADADRPVPRLDDDGALFRRRSDRTRGPGRHDQHHPSATSRARHPAAARADGRVWGCLVRGVACAPAPPRGAGEGARPRSIVFAIGTEVLHVLTVVWYAKRLEHSSELYGGLGAAVVLLAWLYLLGRLTISSAVVNASLWRRSHPVPDDGPRAGEPGVGFGRHGG